MGAQRADVVIIGAGFTGLSTAWQLIQRHPQLGVVVLEARHVGAGASGRNGGMALHWLHGPELEDEALCRRVWSVTDGAIDELDALIQRLRAGGATIRWTRDGCLEAVTDGRRAASAHRDAERLQAWGVPVRWVEGAELRARVDAVGVVGGTFDPSAGQLHGLDLLVALAAALEAAGVRICEDSAVVRIEEGREHAVHTADGSVRAPAMVLATNGYTPSLGYFRSGMFPLLSHVFATAPRDAAWWAERGWGALSGFSDDLDRIAYAGRSADGRLVFGGGSNAAYAYQYGNRTAFRGSAEEGQRAIEARFRHYFPRVDAEITHRWSGTLGITLDRVCSMGVRGDHRNVYYALGYSGHGVVLANLAGRVLADLYDDHHEPWRDLPFYQRRLWGLPPEPLRWLGYQAYTRLTGRSPRRR